jgi:hypothetical protein
MASFKLNFTFYVCADVLTVNQCEIQVRKEHFILPKLLKGQEARYPKA